MTPVIPMAGVSFGGMGSGLLLLPRLNDQFHTSTSLTMELTRSA